MKNWTASVIACCFLAVVIAYAADDNGKQDQPGIASLKGKIEALEKRVAALEARQLGELVTIDPLAQPSLPAVKTVPDGGTVPAGWQRREFNGMPYYLVPIAASPNKAASPDR